MSNFKVKTPRSPKYLAWIRTQPCCICGIQHFIHAHHTTTGAMSLKGSDLETVPLCHTHHAKVHQGRKDNISGLKEIIRRLQTKYKEQQ